MCTLHGKTKQANDIILVENIDTVRTEKKGIVEVFNEHFIQISDSAVLINENDYCNDFEHRPSVDFIYEHSRDTYEPLCSDCRYTNKALVARFVLDMNTRKSCGHDLTPPKLVKESAAAISNFPVLNRQYINDITSWREDVNFMFELVAKRT